MIGTCGASCYPVQLSSARRYRPADNFVDPTINQPEVEEVEESWSSTALETEDSGSGSDNERSKLEAWQRKGMYLAYIGIICVLSAGILISEVDASDNEKKLRQSDTWRV